MAHNPIWNFTPQWTLPYPYHEHPTRPEICGHWHFQHGPALDEQRLIPVVQAYSSNGSPSDDNWVGWLVWYTGSIKDDPIFVAKDLTDVRNWGCNEDLFAEAIYNALHGGGWNSNLTTLTILDKQHDTYYTDGMEPAFDSDIMNCGNIIDANGSDPNGGFNITEAHGIVDWNNSSYSASWPGLWNHEFNLYESSLGYPDHPRVFTGTFFYDMDDSLADSTSLQCVAYEWKDAEDPVWDLPTPDDYGPYVTDPIDDYLTSNGDNGGQNQDQLFTDYVNIWHQTPTGYDNLKRKTQCAKMHQLWGFGHIVVNGSGVDDVFVGGWFMRDTGRMGAATNNEEYMYQGCDLSDWGGNDGTPLDYAGVGNINGHAWYFLVDSWPAGIHPVYDELYDGGTDPWTREQYFICAGTLFDKSVGDMGFFDAWQGKKVYTYNEYWTDYDLQTGLVALNNSVVRQDETEINWGQSVLRYLPTCTFYHGGSSTQYTCEGTIVADRLTTGDATGASGVVGSIDLSGITYNDVYNLYSHVSYGDNAVAFCGVLDSYCCVGNHISWDHNQETSSSSSAHSYTWLVWYNGITREFESNMQDIEYSEFDSYARYQQYTAENNSTLYYHNVWDDDRSATDGTSPNIGYRRRRHVLLYGDNTYSAIPGTGGGAGHDPRWPFEKQTKVL